MRHPETRGGDETKDAGRDPGHLARAARRFGILGALAILPLVAVAGPGVGAAMAAEPEIPPIVVIKPAVAVPGGFEMKATIYTYSLDTHYHFEYGTTTTYGTNLPVPDGDAGTAPEVQVSQVVTGVQPNTTYHFRLTATNSKGPGSSADEKFTTPADPSVPPPPAPEQPPTSGGGSSKSVQLKLGRYKGHSILTTSSGRTLYSLSAEKNGKFICTKASGCLALWHPLMVPKNGTVKGPVTLGTIKRPDGGSQVTYHGRPLYTFAEDVKPGQVGGQGLKDVGTWHAVTVPKPKR